MILTQLVEAFKTIGEPTIISAAIVYASRIHTNRLVTHLTDLKEELKQMQLMCISNMITRGERNNGDERRNAGYPK